MESKYRRLYKELLEKIEKREYRPGDKLPAEGELMEIYGASRDTVRKALGLLEEDGCIRKARGKAAEVLDKSKFNFPVSEIASFKEIYRYSDSRPRTFVENLEIVKNDKKLMEALQIGPEDEAFVLERVREIDGEKIIIDKDYFSRKVVENLPLRAAQDSVYEYLENEQGLKIGFAMKEITVHTATDEDYRLLDMGRYDMVVVVKSYTYLEDSTLFQYTESRHRPDKFKFVDFARRKL
ncbi:MAG TPA: trehalose operon repressor [Lachnoclostridium sp.]|uniref:Trehalose operon repressor n=2 Tax=Lacrimispora TaxID=2719231 RepID=A0A2M8YZN1_9FIRM|nr:MULTISPECIES: trehalose operon repressor [Lacrimispora]PJJ26651.1 GntR family trehalose operon transcriptional repressor [[Clostridium] celerecrescens 18A]SET92260.1 GntR family transcriptional regulator, trehalose operon transcriptional repressor [[Clostridium] sphenoides JCM 1415]SUY52378.1 GntR family transcriptional regulator [Lacrimispora sphenoides]HBE85606.1 trehalose operon repressor [Lachnoclostridium sp.]